MTQAQEPERRTHSWAIGLGAIAVAGVAAVGLKARSITRGTFPAPPQPYHITPRARTLPLNFPSQLDPASATYFYARVRTPTPLADPLAAFMKAFYAHPWFAIEGWAARRWGYAKLPRAPGISLAEVAPSLPGVSSTGPSMVNVQGTEAPGTTFVGIFTIVQRTPDAALMYWTTPNALLKGRADAVAGGTHELAAIHTDGGVELSFGTTHFTLGGGVKPRSEKYLEWDSRLLLHSAARRLERWARAGKV